MKINEVEQLVGVTKRNIRFYEKEGLLSPGRTDNGYRDYGEADVEALRKIKLLRKLDVPLEEIRRMQQGTLTLTDGVRRHIIQLERAQDNLATMRSLCQELAESGEQLASLDAGRWLEKMERMEEGGTQFMNIRKNDIVTRYGGTVAAALVFVALMGGLIAGLGPDGGAGGGPAPGADALSARHSRRGHHRRAAGPVAAHQTDSRRRRRCCF